MACANGKINLVIQKTRLIQNLDTNTPHPPSSSTQATSTGQNTASTDGSENTVLSESQNEKYYLRASDETPEVPKKNRGLLHVPSRSSSQHKIQPSPTSTGLSGVTASDPRGSIGGRSKDSKGSILGRRRNGSATSSKMSIAQQGPTTGPTGNNTNLSSSDTMASKQPKKKGFLSFLCCGAPDHPNTLDQNDSAAPANRVAKVPAVRPTTASRAEQSSIVQNNVQTPPQTEKEALQQEVDNSGPKQEQSGLGSKEIQSIAANGEANSRPTNVALDQPLPNLPKEAESATQNQTYTPSSDVPVAGSSQPVATGIVVPVPQENKDSEGDVKMGDSESVAAEKEETPPPAPTPIRDESANINRQALPPPPPIPAPSTNDNMAPALTEQKQQWLLPPIAPRFKGKKCLVLDLDETLVHSSFKVYFLMFGCLPQLIISLDSSPS
jgi:RNA polymerase II subunit A small phosphatase-like protein